MSWLVRAGNEELGPLSESDLVAWAKAGRLRSGDLVWRTGMPEWLPARQVPEFAPYVAAVPSQKIGDDAMMRALLPVGRSGWAIAAGYLGLFAILLLPAPFALLAGILAVRDIRRHPDRHGMGRAIFGIVMGILGCVALGFLFVGRS
jgi:hypothetical protein